MARFLHHDSPAFQRKGSTLFLALCWLTGLVSGCVFSASADTYSASLMRMAADSPVSIVGLLGVILLPLLFTAFAVSISQIWLIFPIAFLKAFLFSCVAMGIRLAYGQAGWLFQSLLMFSDFCMLPVLQFVWYRCITGRCSGFTSVCALIPVAAVIAGIDYWLISPILAGL